MQNSMLVQMWVEDMRLLGAHTIMMILAHGGASSGNVYFVPDA